MSLQHVKDTPTKRLFTVKFEFWVPRKYMVSAYEDQVAGVYTSGVAGIDEMQMNEEVPARLTIASAAEMASTGARMRVGDPGKHALTIFKMLLEHSEYVKQQLQDDNTRAPSLEATQKLESFMRMIWQVARNRIKDPTEFSGFNKRLGELTMRRRVTMGLGRRKANDGPTTEEQLRSIRRSDFQGTQMEELIVRRSASRGNLKRE